MSWIKIIGEQEADGKLAEIYRQVKSPSGQIDNIIKVHSLRPRTLEGHLEIYKAAVHSRPNALSPRERELVGVTVSQLNGCDYCVEHHRSGLARHLGSEDLAYELSEAAVRKRESDNITEKELAMCAYAAKLTQTPASMTEADLSPLREVNLEDEAILDLNQIVAYFAYANRTVLGLGVNTEGEILGLHPNEDDEGFRHS
jgi:uncharacterized peroxidase-related enzyme